LPLTTTKMGWQLQACPGQLLLLIVLTVSSEGSVQRISPTSGSLCGGTQLSIYGSGFANGTSANRVDIGGDECKVESVKDGVLICIVPFQDAKVVTGKEIASKPVTVFADGKQLSMSTPLKFMFDAKAAPVIVDWGGTSGQANDVLSFQGKEVLSGASVALNGKECQVKYSKGNVLQCVPPAGEAGISNVEVSFGKSRGFACPGPKAPPLKFTYNLALQSALASEFGDDTDGPLDGGAVLTNGPCSPRTNRSRTLTVVGQGLSESTVFKLCGGDTWCTREGPVTADPEIYHGGDWSFQAVTCRPGPLDPSKAPGGSRICDLTAEAADGMFVATLPSAWTYTSEKSLPPPVLTPAPTPQPSPSSRTLAPPAVASASPGPAPNVVTGIATAAQAAPAAAAPSAAAPSGPTAPAAPAAAPQPVAMVPVPTPAPQGTAKKAVKKMAKKVLSKVFKSIADVLGGPPKAVAPALLKDVSPQLALPPPYVAPPPPPSGIKAASMKDFKVPPKAPEAAAAPAPSPGITLLLEDIKSDLFQHDHRTGKAERVLRGLWRQSGLRGTRLRVF